MGVKLEPSPLRLPKLHSGSSPALLFTMPCTRTFNLWEILKCTFMATSKQARTLTHFCNAVLLVLTQARPNNMLRSKGVFPFNSANDGKYFQLKTCRTEMKGLANGYQCLCVMNQDHMHTSLGEKFTMTTSSTPASPHNIQYTTQTHM